MKLSNIDNLPTVLRPQPLTTGQKNIGGKEKTKAADDFKEILKEKTGLNFSNHAIDRLSDRGLNLDDKTVDRLTKAVQMADKKGADQSLVLLDQLAFLVSVRNKTVITAVETDRMKEGVFTQIDSAIIG